MRLSLVMPLFVAMFVTNVSIGQDDSAESHAIQEIERLKGTITRDETLPGHPVIAVDLGQSPRVEDKSDRPDNRCLKPLLSFPNLSSLDLSDCKITDAGLKTVAKMTKLTTLNLSGNKITEAGLRELRKLKALTALGLSFTSLAPEVVHESRALRT